KKPKQGYYKDEYGFIHMDVTCIRYKDEPFILTSQVEQVYYVKAIKRPNWCSMVKVKPRNTYDVPKQDNVQEEAYQQAEMGSFNHVSTFDDVNFVIDLDRDDIEGCKYSYLYGSRRRKRRRRGGGNMSNDSASDSD
ncbi:hypothetical protein PIB30_097957, partial [Stylosanthes scabra]|nr:hypothetical protein [Stylosanthes scabra]